MKSKLSLCLLLLCLAPAARPQSGSTQTVRMNVTSVGGLTPGYRPATGSGLTIAVAPGTALCNGVLQSYAGGTLTMPASATNYVYLDPTASCAPASNTAGFVPGVIPIATVVTAASSIASLADVRTVFASGSGTGACSANQFVVAVNSGQPTCAQPSFLNLGGVASPSQLPAATATSPGAVQVAGDLTGAAASPALVATGVTPGTYTKLTVDGKGRATSGAQAQFSDIGGAAAAAQLPAAIATAQGAVQLAGDLAGTAGAPRVGGLQGNAVAATVPAANQVLTWNGTSWAPAAPAVGGVSSLQFDANPPLAGAVQVASGNGLMSSQSGQAVTLTVNNASPTLEGILALAGDLSGTALAPKVAGLQGNAVTAAAPAPNQILAWNGTAWAPAAPGGGGTVTSVGLSAPPEFSVSGSPVTTAGTLTFTKVGQYANSFYAGPSGGATAPPAFRSIVAADLPAATTATQGALQLAGDLAGSSSAPTVAGLEGKPVSATAPTTSQVLAWNGSAWAPATPAGGAGTGSCAASQFVTSVNSGAPTCAQPAFSNLSGTAAAAQLPAAAATSQGALQLAGDLGGTAASPTITNGSHITNASIANSGLVNNSTTVNGQICALGSTCNVNYGATQYSVAVNGASGAAMGGVACGAGTVLQGAASANPTCTATPTGGVQNTTQGKLTLAGSSSSPGQLVLNVAGSYANGATIQNPSATAAYNFNLPATAGTTGFFLTSAGGGSTANTWTGLASGDLFVGSSTGVPTAVAMSGDATLANTGAVTVAKIRGTTPGGSCTNQVVTSLSVSAVPTCTTVTSAYVNNSIALTGTDINTSNQVTSTHLASALPLTQGGTGQTTASAAFNALAPATAQGGLIVGSGSNSYGNLALGSNGQCLTSNGTTAAWGSCGSAGSGSPGGTDTAVQYNSAGSFGGDATNFSYNYNTHNLTITGTVTANSFQTTGTGAGYTQWTAAAMSPGAAGTVACGASAGNTYSCSDNGGAVTPMAMIAGDLGGAQGVEQVNGLHLMAEGSTGNQSLTTTVANDTTTGTAANALAKLTSTGAIEVTTSDTAIPAYIVVSNAGKTGSAHLAMDGQATCVMDATASGTEGQFVQASTTTAGDCHATGSAAAPSSGWVVGQMVSNSTTAGSAATVKAFHGYSASGGGSGSGTVTSVGTTSPITGGTITSSGTIACPTCATTASGGALTAVGPVAITAGGAISLQNSTSANVTAALGTDAKIFTASGSAATSGDVIEGDSYGGVVDSGTLLSSLAPKGSPTFTGTVTLPVTGSTQCLHVNSSGVVSGTSSDCGTGSGSTGSAVSAVTTNAVTISSPATDTKLAELTLPAGYLNSSNLVTHIVGKGFYTTASSQTPTITVKLKLCSVSGCGSGTVVALYTGPASGATTASVSNSFQLDADMATTATGSSGAVLAHALSQIMLGATGGTNVAVPSSTVNGDFFIDANTAACGTINLTQVWYLDLVWQFSSGTTNTVTPNLFSINTGGGGGTGTVTSVTFTGDGIVDSSTPSTAVTTSGTITATPLTHTANTVLAGPASGSAATPTFRALTPADGAVGACTTANTCGFLAPVGAPANLAASSWTNPGANAIDATQFYLPFKLLVTTIAINVTTSVASSHCYVGVYDNTTNHALLLDSGALSAASAGIMKATGLSITLNPGFYWSTTGCDNASVALAGVYMSSVYSGLAGVDFAVNGTAANLISGANPSTLGAISSNSNNPPAVWLHP